MVMQSLGKLRRLVRVLNAQSDVKATSKNATIQTIVTMSLLQEANAAVRGAFVGFLVFLIGTGFFWLCANSWHITSTDWIGGLQGLIHALTVQEISLLPCLYFMIQDGIAHLKKSTRIQELASTIREKQTLSQTGVEELELLANWSPFWKSGVGVFQTYDEVTEMNHIQYELKQLEKYIKDLSGKKSKDSLVDLADELDEVAQVTRMEGYREFLYFVLNFCAFYGYFMGIVCYYWSDEATHPVWVQRCLFGMSVSVADWRGNMAGDSAWAIEPMVILASPFLMNVMTKKKKTGKKKAKSE
jgi:hypothetical protein